MRYFGLFLVGGLLVVGQAHAQVDANLGTIVAGTSVSISGTTVGRSNDIDTYSPIARPTFVWDQDFIYQFDVTAPGLLTLDSNDPNSAAVDMDFFLLNSLATTINANGLREANAISSTTLNSPVVIADGSWNITTAGTYYFAIDAYRGNPASSSTPAVGRAGAFSGSLSFVNNVPAPPPPSISAALQTGASLSGSLAAGQISWRSFNYSGTGGFSINTDGSLFNTRLGLYNSLGQLILSADGSTNATFVSAPAGLAAGTYYLALGGGTTATPSFGATGFAVTPGTMGGSYIINGIVPVPEPTTPLLLGLGALVGSMVHVRKRRMKR